MPPASGTPVWLVSTAVIVDVPLTPIDAGLADTETTASPPESAQAAPSSANVTRRLAVGAERDGEPYRR